MLALLIATFLSPVPDASAATESPPSDPSAETANAHHTGKVQPTEETPEADADDDAGEASERDWVFMPAVELGLLYHQDPNLPLAAVFRTSIDYRFRRVAGPYLRLSYDAGSPRLTQRNVDGATLLRANMAMHDVYMGGGYRFGPKRWQIVTGAHLGVQITEVPSLATDADDVTSVGTRLRATGLAVASVGFEFYFDRRTAATLDLSGRLRFERLNGGSRFGLVATVGLATAL